MLKNLQNKKAQAVMGEYMVLIGMVLAAIVVMTVYFKRAVQARVYDARNYMVSEVRSRAAGEYDGDLYFEYEPYYTNTETNISVDAVDETRLLPGGMTGIFQ